MNLQVRPNKKQKVVYTNVVGEKTVSLIISLPKFGTRKMGDSQQKLGPKKRDTHEVVYNMYLFANSLEIKAPMLTNWDLDS